MNKKILITLILILLISIGFIWRQFLKGRVHDIPRTTLASNNGNLQEEPLFSEIASNLKIPWSLDFLPGGDIIFTERPGRVRLISKGKGLLSEPLLTLDDVEAVGEGGLLGITLHPDFNENRYIYLYYTYKSGESLFNRVVRYEYREKLSNPRVILENIPAGEIHNGGRIKFGPDGYLYITAGDSGTPKLAQIKKSFAGKILRVTDEGNIPEDNPFEGSFVYSLGHRNPQGIAWDEIGLMFATEHGQSAHDEVNIINAGKNYGWPVIQGDEAKENLTPPLIHSGEETWAPSGCTFYKDTLFFAGLRGQSLYNLDRKNVLRVFLKNKFGRLRDVSIGPDNFFYILTNNTDGRGIPSGNDDRIIRVNPEKLFLETDMFQAQNQGE